MTYFGSVVLEKKILKNFQCIFTLSLLSPFGIRGCPSYNKSESPVPKDDLCQDWLQLAQWFWRSRKCKSLTDRRQTDDGQKVITQNSSLELSAQVS
jgi:hypothetical protein